MRLDVAICANRGGAVPIEPSRPCGRGSCIKATLPDPFLIIGKYSPR